MAHMVKYMSKDFASQREVFSFLMAKSLESCEPGVDKHGFRVLKGEDLCNIEIDPDLDQETRIQLAVENFEESLKNTPEDNHLVNYVVS
jgi:hypothetical protein